MDVDACKAFDILVLAIQVAVIGIMMEGFAHR